MGILKCKDAHYFLESSVSSKGVGISLCIQGKYGVNKWLCSGLVQCGNQKFFLSTKEDYRLFINGILSHATGVLNGHYVELSFVGLGYRYIYSNNVLFLKIGYSHYLRISVPKGIYLFGYNKHLIIFGISLGEVRSFSERLRLHRRPDVYKGKGIQYLDEVLQFKEGKKQQ